MCGTFNFFSSHLGWGKKAKKILLCVDVSDVCLVLFFDDLRDRNSPVNIRIAVQPA